MSEDWFCIKKPRGLWREMPETASRTKAGAKRRLLALHPGRTWDDMVKRGYEFARINVRVVYEPRDDEFGSLPCGGKKANGCKQHGYPLKKGVKAKS